MGITFQLEASTGIVCEQWQGPVTIQEIEAHWKARLAAPSVAGTGRTLADIRGARFQFRKEDLWRLITAILEPGLKERSLRMAVLVDAQVQFSMARQFQTFFGELGECALFTEEPAAREWLQRPPGPGKAAQPTSES